MAEWGDFFVAQVGASAALAGLIFVGISISVDQIVAYPHLVFRAVTAIVLMLSTLVTSSVLLAPLPSDESVAYALLAIGGVSWLLTSGLAAIGQRRTPHSYQRSAWFALAMVQVAMLPLVIAGIVVLASGMDGLYWVLPGFMASYSVALVNGWVLLVETHR